MNERECVGQERVSECVDLSFTETGIDDRTQSIPFYL